MSVQAIARNYASYNVWATERLVEWLLTIPEEIVMQEVSSSFPSVASTIGHIQRTQQFWTTFVEGKDLTNFTWGIPNASFQELLRDMQGSAKRLRDLVNESSNDYLTEVLHLAMPWAQNDLPRYEYIIHMINHCTYHRGQIVTIAHVLGAPNGIPNTDYNIFRCE